MRKSISLLGALLAFWSALPAVAQPAAAAGAVPPLSAPAASDVGVNSIYRLGPGDKIRVIVYNEATLSGEFLVGDDGTLSMPLIGTVAVLGRGPAEVAKDIETRLADGYLREPHVSLDVLTYRPFYILGEVSKPGTYPYSNGISVLEAVATAEGYTYRANKRKVVIKRAGETEEHTHSLTPDLKIYPGDTVRVLERYF